MTAPRETITKEEMDKMSEGGEDSLKIMEFLRTKKEDFSSLRVIVRRTKLSSDVATYILRNAKDVEKIVFAGEFYYRMESDTTIA